MECNFTKVDAETYKLEYIRDTFIGGLQSKYIRQRLLESNITDFKLLFEQARILETTQNCMDSFTTPLQNENIVNAISKKNSTVNCWNCGNPSHAKSLCPARNFECFNCGKKGHFSKFCKAKNKTSAFINSSVSSSSLESLPVSSSSLESNTKTCGMAYFPTLAHC